MIASLHLGAIGIGVALVLALACRDAPLAPDIGHGPARISADVATDTVAELPSPAEILWARTTTFFYDDRYGGSPYARITADMEYIGNRAAQDIKYSVRGDVADIDTHVLDEQSRFYSPFARHRFTSAVDVATQKSCGLTINANTLHTAWWFVWVLSFPSWQSTKDMENSVAPTLQTDLCPVKEEEAPEEGGGSTSGGGSGSGGWIMIETCHYWAHFLRGELVEIELRYCEHDIIPLADE